jgi:hypothetical protein
MKNLTLLSLILIAMSSCSQGYIPIAEQQQVPSGPINYQRDIRPVIASRCISCHGGSNPEAGLLLETYIDVRNSAESGSLIQRINDPANPMPSSGLMPVSTRALFDQWRADGYLEN